MKHGFLTEGDGIGKQPVPSHEIILRYNLDSLSYLLQMEEVDKLEENFMKPQRILTEWMRRTLLEWMNDVVHSYNLVIYPLNHLRMTTLTCFRWRTSTDS